MSSTTEMIEHVVMMNIQDDDLLKVDSIIESINSLSSISEVLYLTAGPILRTHTFPDNLQLTHLVHARFSSLSDLHSYIAHPAHVSLHNALTANPIVSDDFIALDWAWPTLRPKPLLPGQALRFTSFKLKDGDSPKKDEIIEGLSKIKGAFDEMTYGEEIMIEWARGFKVVTVAVFDEMEAREEYEDAMRPLIDQFKDAVDGVISVDYVVPVLSGPTTTSTV